MQDAVAMMVPVRQTRQDAITKETTATVEFAPDDSGRPVSLTYVHGRVERQMTERSQQSVMYRQKWDKLCTSLDNYTRSPDNCLVCVFRMCIRVIEQATQSLPKIQQEAIPDRTPYGFWEVNPLVVTEKIGIEDPTKFVMDWELMSDPQVKECFTDEITDQIKTHMIEVANATQRLV